MDSSAQSCYGRYMAGRERTDEQVVMSITMALPSRGAPVPFGKGLAIWGRFTATFEPQDPASHSPTVELDVDASDGKPKLQEVRLRRREGGDLKPSIRLPLGEYMKAAVLAATLEVASTGSGSWKLSPASTPESMSRAIVQFQRQEAVSRRTWSEADARKALRLHTQAKKRRDLDPLQKVADQLGKSRSTAHTMVKAARKLKEKDDGRSRRAKK